MADLYKIIDELLRERGISGAKMSSDLGMSRSFMTELRKGRAKSIKTETARKIAEYFGVSTDYLLGNVSEPLFHLDNERILAEVNSYGDETEKAPTGSGERSVSDDDIKFALFGGDGEITDAMYDEVRNFAAYVKQREADKKKG